jgi:hypothetical protein
MKADRKVKWVYFSSVWKKAWAIRSSSLETGTGSKEDH